MTQPTLPLWDTLLLFDIPEKIPPYQRGSSTSRDAALSTNRAKGLRMVLNHIVSRGEAGATYREIMQATGLCSGTVCARINDLVKAGDVVRTIRKRQKCGVVVGRIFYGKAA